MVDIEFFAYFTLLFAILSLWLFESRKFSLILTGASLVLGLISENIDTIGFVITIVFFGGCMLYYRLLKTTPGKIALWICITVVAILMRAHIMPGFYNWQLIDAEILSTNASEYSSLAKYGHCICGPWDPSIRAEPNTSSTPYNTNV